MTWLNALVPFAAGVVRGFASEFSRPETAAHPCHSAPPRDSDFQSCVLAYGRAAGLGTPQLHGQTVAFTVPIERVPYMVLFSPGPGSVIASAHCNLTFPGTVPGPVLRAVEGQNRKDDSGCFFDQIDHAEGVSFCSITHVDAHRFSERAFSLMVTTLTRRAAALDRALMKSGYGN